VALAARSAAKLHELANAMPDALVAPADVKNVGEVDAMVASVLERFQRIDVLINNAGQNLLALVEHVGVDEFQAVLDVNVLGPLRAMQAVLPVMREQGDGTIVHVTSGTVGVGIPGLGAYSASKAAGETLFVTARVELAEENIRLILFSPGPTATGLGDNALRTGPANQPFQVRSAAGANTPASVAAALMNTLEADLTEYRWSAASR
jgi:NADP-dependent 3-hydroxy acid dehydrogenase YdfG